MRVLFAKGTEFEGAAIRSDLFPSLDQVQAAARALTAAGLLVRADDGGLVAAQDITDAELAFVLSSENERLEAEG